MLNYGARGSLLSKEFATIQTLHMDFYSRGFNSDIQDLHAYGGCMLLEGILMHQAGILGYMGPYREANFLSNAASMYVVFKIWLYISMDALNPFINFPFSPAVIKVTRFGSARNQAMPI